MYSICNANWQNFSRHKVFFTLENTISFVLCHPACILSNSSEIPFRKLGTGYNNKAYVHFARNEYCLPRICDGNFDVGSRFLKPVTKVVTLNGVT